MAQEYAPVRTEAAHEPLPVHQARTMAEQVCDIGAVVSLAFHDERLGPDHLFCRHQLDGDAQDSLVHGMRKPLVVDFCQPIAGVIDHIDELLAVMGLGEPVMERDLRSESAASQYLEHATQIARSGENVEVL